MKELTVGAPSLFGPIRPRAPMRQKRRATATAATRLNPEEYKWTTACMILVQLWESLQRHLGLLCR
jgi:hypothetical protein